LFVYCLLYTFAVAGVLFLGVGEFVLSTITVSSSLLVLRPRPALLDVVEALLSSSFMKSSSTLARFFAHHSCSFAVDASISAMRLRKTVFAWISFADWKMI
jgi:hypothetical protein